MSRPGGSQRAGVRGPSDARGVTLIELLVAMAIGSMLLIAVAGLLSSARAGEGALSRSVEPSQALQLAAELLREELGMAGFIPFPPGSTPTLPTGTARVRVKDNGGGAGHSLGIGFIDDRLASGPVLRDLSFSTGVDGRGDAQLYRRAASGTRQPLVEGIASLRLAAFV